MSPNLNSSSQNINIKNLKNKEIIKKIRSYQNFIKKNFKFVGNNFSYEARSMHYNNKNPKNGIYGTVTKEEIKELKDEGINTHIVPWIEDKEN